VRKWQGGCMSACVLFTLAACGAKTAGTLKPQDAASWLHKACGVAFGQDPVVLPSTSGAQEVHKGSSVVVTATVLLPAAEVEAALASLRNNRDLHSRGQSATRYSYESYPDATVARACELDTSLHVLYFRYAE
jgi:hypothetical protein